MGKIGRIQIFEGGALSYGPNDLIRTLENLRNFHDFIPDVILVDYCELMQASGNVSQMKEYERQGFIFDEMPINIFNFTTIDKSGIVAPVQMWVAHAFYQSVNTKK